MIVLDGKIDIVMEWRKKEWVARAWGISFGQHFFGFIFFRRKEGAVKSEPGSYKQARGVLKK